MDDPSRRAGTASPGGDAPLVEVRTVGVAPAGMPQVTVHVSNVIAYGSPAPQQMHPHVQPQSMTSSATSASSPIAAPSPTPFAMMTDDASLRAREALVRSGPARVLGRIVGFGLVALMIALLFLMVLGVSPLAVLIAEVPVTTLAVVAFVVARRAGVGVGSHHLEREVLRVAAEHHGVVRVAVLARATGRSLRECQVALDALVTAGHATVDADDRGGLLYRVPDLEPGSVRNLLEENR